MVSTLIHERVMQGKGWQLEQGLQRLPTYCTWAFYDGAFRMLGHCGRVGEWASLIHHPQIVVSVHAVAQWLDLVSIFGRREG